MVEHEGKKSFLEYLVILLTKEEKETWKTLIGMTSRVTIKDYPPEAAFLIEHNRKIMGHIPEYVLQEYASDNYKRFLVKHINLPEELLSSIAWNLFAEAISKINLAKLLPVLKFINNKWSTGDKMDKYFKKDPRCPMCGTREDPKHVFSCNSLRAKQTRNECLYSLNRIFPGMMNSIPSGGALWSMDASSYLVLHQLKIVPSQVKTHMHWHPKKH